MKYLRVTLQALTLCLATLPVKGIAPNPVEIQIANLAINHPSQARPTMVHDPILNLVARAKALDLAKRAYFSHVDPDGYGPNKAVQLAGYGLPGWYGTSLDANYIESISAGYASAQAAFDGWIASAGHRRHLLAEIPFYAEQTRYGVGYVELPGSPYVRYYVFISAPPNQSANAPLEPYVEWLFSHYSLIEIATSDDSSDHDGDGISRLTEFVLQFHPKIPQSMPPVTLNRTTNRMEWLLPARTDLGSVSALVEQSSDLQSWTTAGVDRTGNVFSIAIQPNRGFMKLSVTRAD